MLRRRFVLTTIGSLAAPAVVRAQETLKSAKAGYRLVTLSRDLEQPWSIAFLPDGRMLISERPGRLRVFANGKLERPPLVLERDEELLRDDHRVRAAVLER